MPELGRTTLEAAAAAYEQRLVPALFESWTGPMAAAAGLRTGQRVLDVACGTGVLARRAAAEVGPGGSVVGLDLNPGMLALAARIAPGISWRQGAAEALPFEDGAFDVVLCQFGLMFFSDRVQALREMLRMLAPGGRLAAAVFDRLARNPAYAALASVYGRHAGKNTADALRAPFSLGNRPQLLDLFETAGAAAIRIADETRTARFASMRDLVLADVEGWFPLAGLELDDATIEAVVLDARATLAGFVGADDTVAFPIQAQIVTATKG